nr:unnamed protein product [Callosobruchus analis]CAI5849544.1 unnamed protein product [Callosobruchus analis]
MESSLEHLPKDARTILKTHKSSLIRNVTPGHYCHIGLEKGIKCILDEESNLQFKEIQLKIGIDGLPISESSNSHLWPILASVYPSSKVFLVGAYHGYSKPSDSNDFIYDFVTEITHLINNGITHNGNLLNVSLYCLVCDAPAKSFLTKTKGHTAQVDDEYHLGQSILTNIPNFGMVTQIPLDYMHLVCIGVVKKMIGFWLNGKLSVRIRHQKVLALSEKLRVISLRPNIVKEFARRPQAIQTYSKWKATELRQFLLYTCPVVLKDILPMYMYNHFLSLHIAINLARVDSSSSLCWSEAQEKREGWKPHFCKTTHTQNPQRNTTHRHQPRSLNLFKFFRGWTPGLIVWAVAMLYFSGGFICGGRAFIPGASLTMEWREREKSF